MLLRRLFRLPWVALALVLAASVMITAPAQVVSAGRVEAPRPSAVVWHDPGNVAGLDLFYGAGGKEHAPGSTFTFVKEDMNGTSVKFDVKDDQGVEWKVKLGAEPRSETAATRLLWAAGYFVDEDYYVADLKVEGLVKLHRGQKLVSSDGMVHGARLERRVKKVEELGNWSWFDNSCGQQQTMNGLIVMMALVNNWDLKSVNNSLQEIDGERRCVVTDLGATFGKTGNVLGRSKSVAKDYAHAKFIAKVRPDSVDFVMHSRPIFLAVFAVPNYIQRSKMEKITRHIPRADARWLGQRLAQLSPEQLHDCFRGAGYTPEEVNVYTQAVQHRIAELNAL